MSETQIDTVTLAPARAATARAAVARAAQATGVDFHYLLAQAKLESSLDPRARAGGSSAAGLFQFTRGTWQRTLAQHGDTHGYGWATTGGPAAQALRLDPQASALMAAELARDNGTALSAQLGRQPDAAELYLAHFLGAGGAGRFLATLAADPGRSAAALLPDAAAANRAVFYDAGHARSVGGVMALLRGRMDSAMAGESGALEPADAYLDPLPAAVLPSPTLADAGAFAPVSMANPGFMPPPAVSPWPGAAAAPPAPTERPHTSMADVLGNAFGLGGTQPSQAPGFVRSAYAQLRAWDL